MSLVVMILSAVLIGLAIGQLPLVALFVRALLKPQPQKLDDSECVPALVVLSLRGSDPFLRDCITALIHQDYPQFDVRIVIDGRADPAWEIAEAVLRDHPAENVRIEALEARRPTCSLKCSSMLQAVADLDPCYEFVAQLDADTVPHSTWLRELAGGFEDPSVGAVTGNRWYFPALPTLGSLVRYLWNVGAVVQMYVYGIAWGGTLAVRADLIEVAGLRDRWSRAFCEDTMLSSVLRPLGRRVLFVPSLMMINRETCTLSGYDAWVRRQLLTARLYHPAWPAVACHGIGTSLALLLVSLVGFAAILLQDWTAIRVSLVALICYQVCMLGSLLVIELCVRRVACRRGESTSWLSLWTIIKCGAAIPLTQAIYARAMLAAAFLKSVTWRGARYDIAGPWEIRLVSDQGVDKPGAAEPIESL